MFKVANILSESVVDGSGIRVVVFFQGCPRRCSGCHNPDLLPEDGGTNYDIRQLADAIDKELTVLHQGVTFSGGDPLMQAEGLPQLVEILRQKRPGIDIWAYTGYTYEEVAGWPVMEAIDVLVDGPYEEEKRDLLLPFRGSANQRLIDVKASLAADKAVEYDLPK